MIDRDSVDDALQRVALAAFIYYPDVRLDEPSYDIGRDVAWCLQPLADLPREERERFGDLVGWAITDPTAHRQETIAALSALATP
ncbi:hypothetical protein [Microbacterium sp. No. 7]|uniref:hypothetical protein n=1 Tax=Microbacterium sp. No. 7 TaxID=1714373 RepID=UPI0006D0FE58|nr:hypothetical protein [Microbacterium sp. No. 7]ALJ21447.1 hypothetical protein AOA12_16725 [Microbacterium sp. No. 7]